MTLPVKLADEAATGEREASLEQAVAIARANTSTLLTLSTKSYATSAEASREGSSICKG